VRKNVFLSYSLTAGTFAIILAVSAGCENAAPASDDAKASTVAIGQGTDSSQPEAGATVSFDIDGIRLEVPRDHLEFGDHVGFQVNFLHPTLEPGEYTDGFLPFEAVIVAVRERYAGFSDNKTVQNDAEQIRNWRFGRVVHGMNEYRSPHEAPADVEYPARWMFSDAYVPHKGDEFPELIRPKDLSSMDGVIVCLSDDWPPYAQGIVPKSAARCEHSFVHRGLWVRVRFRKSLLADWMDIKKGSIELLDLWRI